MRLTRFAMLAMALALIASLALTYAPAGYSQGDANRLVAGGGITVPGWMGKVDADAERQGQTPKDAKLEPQGNGMHVMTGPAITYWNPANKASGNYTVSATFNEPKFMNLNDHPHPYGVVIAGNDLGTAQETLLYCAAYGDGHFIVRGFGPQPFQMNGMGEANAAVHKAAAVGQPVTQEIALSVKGNRVECAINGTVVGSYDKAALVGPGKLKSTDGVYGIRFAHNTEAIVTNLKMVAAGGTAATAPAAAPAAAAVAAAAPAAGGDNAALVARGKDRYHAYGCFDCHGQNGEGSEDAPDLVGTRLDAMGIAAFLNKPSADALAKGMPNIPPNSPDLPPLVAFVLSMKKSP